jgi:hypothetical protein
VRFLTAVLTTMYIEILISTFRMRAEPTGASMVVQQSESGSSFERRTDHSGMEKVTNRSVGGAETDSKVSMERQCCLLQVAPP